MKNHEGHVQMSNLMESWAMTWSLISLIIYENNYSAYPATFNMKNHAITFHCPIKYFKKYLIVDFYLEHVGNIFDTLHWTTYMTIQGNI
jgi:hypothetical protein